MSLKSRYEIRHIQGCKCGCNRRTIYTKELQNWNVEEIKEISKQENHPAVVAIMFHEHEKLREILSEGNIDVNTFDFKFVLYTIYSQDNKYHLECNYSFEPRLLISLAFLILVPGIYYSPKIIHCLVSFGAKLEYHHFHRIRQVVPTFCKDLLLTGSLQTKNLSEFRKNITNMQAFRRKHNYEEEKMEANENEILKLLDLWSDELILLYCLDKKNIHFVF